MNDCYTGITGNSRALACQLWYFDLEEAVRPLPSQTPPLRPPGASRKNGWCATMSRRWSRPYLTDARRAFGWLPNALGIFPENVTLRFFSAVCVGVRFVCDVPHASFCGLYQDTHS